MRKKKIINDPVHGFITVRSEVIMAVIDHPWVQRLRRIKQLGLTELVYPGALHTRFHHSLGAMHLMSTALGTLSDRGHRISEEECQAAMIAILLHDVGHGPFSHALEKSILAGVTHEQVSDFVLEALGKEFGPPLELASRMFSGAYERPFFRQLIASQLDCDRLDYLARDCYFTGVLEGSVGSSRLLKMLDLDDQGQIVVEEKGIYSVENVLHSRRVMYWQVYLHKTTLAAEEMLIRLVARARQLIRSGERLWASPALLYFFEHDVTIDDFSRQSGVAGRFMSLDDADVWTAIKAWAHHPDTVLSMLARGLSERRLFKVHLLEAPPTQRWIESAGEAIAGALRVTPHEAASLLIIGQVANAAYLANESPIMIRRRSGEVLALHEATDLPHIMALAQVVVKYHVCYPKGVALPPLEIEPSPAL